jgi:hypothetical protein
MRRSHALLAALVLGIVSTLGMFALSVIGSRSQRGPEEKVATLMTKDEPVEEQTSAADSSTWARSVPRFNSAFVNTNGTEAVSETPGTSVHEGTSSPSAKAFTLEDFTNAFVKDVKASGDASDALAQRGAKILARWNERGPAELRTLAHFTVPECYAKGCVITGTVKDPERLHEISSEFVRYSGLKNGGG